STSKPKVSTGRKIYRFAIVFTLIYCSVGIVLYHLQENLLFHPKALAKDFQFKFDIPFKEVNIPMNETDTLNLIQFFPSDSMPKGVVIYFHGNKGNVTRFAQYAINFTSQGYEVWMPDYPTYGKTTGKLTEENMYKQATEVYKLAHSKFSADRIIVYGRSLGSGVASHIAANHDCARLILETPFFSITDLFSHYAPIYPVNRMSHFKFPVGENLKEVKAPVTIFHGKDDGVISYDAASKLKTVLKPGDQFITIENGNHNHFTESPVFQSKLDSVLNASK
ncbi:MAG TPA: alpha/beta fold hydrolase, partial [Hanamia sp.]|nr:alpha/beta fold hydrolase [Hanamia sp.]